MPALVVPILAQAIALNLGDRTEARVVRDQTATDLEAETRPYTRLSLTWPKSSIAAGYSPVLTVAPLETSTARERRQPGRTEDRHVELLHAADAQASVSFGSARTTLTLSQNGRFAQRNFRRELIGAGTATSSPQGAVGSAGPTTPAPSTGAGGAAGPDAGGTAGGGTAAGGAGTGGGTYTQGTAAGATTGNALGRSRSTPVTWVSETTTFTLGQALSARHSLSFSAGYGADGGIDEDAQRFFPLIHGPVATATITSQLGPRDGLSTALNAQYHFSRVYGTEQAIDPILKVPVSIDRFRATRTAIATATENLRHTFSPTLAGSVGVGLGYARNDRFGRPTDDSFLPTGNLGLDYQTVLGSGNFGALVTTQFNPLVDPTTGQPDWRYTSLVGLVWRGKRLMLGATSQAQLSLTPSRSGGTRVFNTTAQASYDLLNGFNVDAGGRVAWQEYAGGVILYPTQVVFVGLSYGKQIPMN